ncbi:MAG TPA: hypothetical protein PKV80_18490 [Leptospiraceae bacterium]|nr:hypothetical protein [Leptospiraceae bacterium]
MIFKKSRQNWNMHSIKWNEIQKDLVSEKFFRIIAVTALLESRSGIYSSYLLRCLRERPEWHKTVKIWGKEESLHGRALSRLSLILNEEYDIKNIFRIYKNKIKYHEGAPESVRGSVEGEMTARCTVEALAVTYYKALKSECSDPEISGMLNCLIKDESRHFGMFYTMKNLEDRDRCSGRLERILIVLKRLIELDDDQITYAAYLVYFGPDTEYKPRKARAAFLSDLYSYYGIKEMDYLSKQLLFILGFQSVVTLLRKAVSWTLFFSVKFRMLFFRMTDRLLSSGS